MTMSDTAKLFSGETLWQRTFDAVPDPIFVLDKDHQIVRANRAAAERLGCTVEQLAGQRFYELVHGINAPPEACPDPSAKTGGALNGLGGALAARSSAISAVTIATPDFAHHAVAVAAARAQKHILMEKPLATTREDLDRVVPAVRRSPAAFMVQEIWIFRNFMCFLHRRIHLPPSFK